MFVIPHISIFKFLTTENISNLQILQQQNLKNNVDFCFFSNNRIFVFCV